MIPKYCKRALRCSYGKTHNPCDLHESCIGFFPDNRKAIQEFNNKPKVISQAEPKKNKFGAVKINADGMTFDSKLEHRRWCTLKMLAKLGKITDLKRQVEFVLIDKTKYGRKISYMADFTYIQDGKLIVEDTKSKATKTPLYRLKKRLMAEKYEIVIKEVEK